VGRYPATVFAFPTAASARRRLPRLLAGLVLCGIGIAGMVLARLGLGPWDVFHQGLSDRTGVPIGTVGILIGFAVLLAWIPLRQRIGLGTVCNIVIIGLVIDAILAVAPEPSAFAVRVVLMAAGPVLVGVGCGLYIGAGLGPGPRDGVMTGLADRGIPPWIARTGVELSALAAGWLLGGTVGAGTLWFALAIGPVAHLALDRFTMDADDHVEAITVVSGE